MLAIAQAPVRRGLFPACSGTACGSQAAVLLRCLGNPFEVESSATRKWCRDRRKRLQGGAE
jgi:hypothetical protein